VNTFFRKLAWLVERRRKEEQLADELQFHLEEEAEQLRERGVADEEPGIVAKSGRHVAKFHPALGLPALVLDFLR
jgi:hypothetical protein